MSRAWGHSFLLSVLYRLSFPTSPSLLDKEGKEERKGKEGEEREERYRFFSGPKEFTPFLVSRWRARPEHSPQVSGSPFVEIASRGDHELGGVELSDTATTSRWGRSGAGVPIARPDPAIATPVLRHRLTPRARGTAGAHPTAAPRKRARSQCNSRGYAGPVDHPSSGPRRQGRRLELAPSVRRPDAMREIFSGERRERGRRPALTLRRGQSAGRVSPRPGQVLSELAEGAWRDERVPARMAADAAVAALEAALVHDVLDPLDRHAEGERCFAVRHAASGKSKGGQGLAMVERRVAGRAALHRPDPRRSRSTSPSVAP